MNTTPSRNRTALAALIALVVVGGVTYTVSAWNAPGSPAPAGNVAGPITTGNAAQTKAGNLQVNLLGAGRSPTCPNAGWRCGVHTWDVWADSSVRASQICLGGSNALNSPDTGTCITNWSQAGGSTLWQQSGSNIYYNAGNVGIGLTNPAYPLHIQSPNGGTMEFAGDYTGAASNNVAWPNYVGTVVKKSPYEVIVGVGGPGANAPGLSATDGTYKTNYFLSSGGLVLDSLNIAGNTSRPIFLQSNRVGVGSWGYAAGETPTAALHVKGDILATTKVTSPKYCIGTSCITKWPVPPTAACPAGQVVTWNGTAFSCTTPSKGTFDVYFRELPYAGNPNPDQILSCDAGDQLVSAQSFREAPLLARGTPFGDAKLVFKTALAGEGAYASFCGPDNTYSCILRIFCLNN